MSKVKIIILFLLFANRFYSQNIDSIYSSFSTIKNDSIKIYKIVNEIVTPLIDKRDFLKADVELKKTYKFIHGNINNFFRIKSAEIQLLISQEKYDSANDSLIIELNKAEKSKNSYYESIFLRLKAQIQLYQGNLDKSTDLFFKALDKMKMTNFQKGIAMVYGDIGMVNYYNEQYDKAIEYWEKSVEIYKKENRKDILANELSNLALAYLETKNIVKAEGALKTALEVANELKSETSKASIYINLAKLEYEKKNLTKAIEYNNLAAKYYESIKNYDKLANIYSNGAELARSNKQYNEALVYINKAFNAINLTENKLNLTNLFLNKSAIYYDLKEYKLSHDFLQLYINNKDSMVNLDNQKNINDLEKKYQLSERKKENALLNQQLKTQEIASSRMKIILGLISIILVILVFIAFFVIKQNRIKNLINAELSEKNSIINHQKTIVEEQHQDITDSIKYARRIQGAILPPKNMWRKILPNSFVLYKPKDVLSGDFYWIEETADYIYVAAADCTGHGVPGALISIVNFNLLNKAVLEKGLVTPSEILDAVNVSLTESLHQTYRESAVRDGMDVSLIAIHKHSNEILFAGANNPIYILSKGELKQIKGDKFPVGAFIEDQIQNFTTKSFKAHPGDTIYLFSDGFADQFGGNDGKKYKYTPFQEKLKVVSNLTLIEQKVMMNEEFNNWKGKHEQVDDVLLIGIKIV